MALITGIHSFIKTIGSRIEGHTKKFEEKKNDIKNYVDSSSSEKSTATAHRTKKHGCSRGIIFQ